jgi:uncharacterized glyoxalase superfamily protein PhnB
MLALKLSELRPNASVTVVEAGKRYATPLLLVVDDPDAVFDRAIGAGADAKSTVHDEHGWRIGRLIDPFGHEWEIGKPLIDWPPASTA